MFACGYVESVNFSLFMITSPAGSCFEKGGISPNFWFYLWNSPEMNLVNKMWKLWERVKGWNFNFRIASQRRWTTKGASIY